MVKRATTRIFSAGPETRAVTGGRCRKWHFWGLNCRTQGGYPSEKREAWLKENGFRNQIQRKGKRNKPLSECQQRRNHRIAKTRARVEHVFGAIEQMGGKMLRTIGQARASFAMTMMAACYNLKRLVYFQKAGIEAF